jgi:hypothetical protein
MEGTWNPSFLSRYLSKAGNVIIGLTRDLDPANLQAAAGVGSTTTGRDV